MLIGTTFAWFTDTATTAVNKIQAGTLDIDIVDAEGTSLAGETLAWQKAAGAEEEEVLWEPGTTYNLQPFKIVNKGNLALKFKLEINGLLGDAKLLEAIDFTVGEGSLATYLEGYEVRLAAGAETELIAISGHMKETAGNEYQGLSVDGIGITVMATQDTVEHDSLDDQYDANATYPVMNDEEFAEALAAAQPGDIITMGEGLFNLPASINTKGLTISGVTGATVVNITQADGTYTNIAADGVTLSNLTLRSGASIVGEPGPRTACSMLQVNGQDVTVENCTFEAVGTANIALQIMNANPTIRNCKFVGGFRQIGMSYGKDGKTILIENCSLKQATYGIHFDQPNGANIIVRDCDIAAWSSFSAAGGGTVTFERCHFADGSTYNYLRPYLTTTLTDCSFDRGFVMNPAEDFVLTVTNPTLPEGVNSFKDFVEADKDFTLVLDGETTRITVG